eukprot:231717-Pelagomonas_calceolata.AAC.2
MEGIYPPPLIVAYLNVSLCWAIFRFLPAIMPIFCAACVLANTLRDSSHYASQGHQQIGARVLEVFGFLENGKFYVQGCNGHATKDGSLKADDMRCECTRFCSSSAAVPSRSMVPFCLPCYAAYTHTIRTLLASCLLPARSLPKDCCFTLSSLALPGTYKELEHVSIQNQKIREFSKNNQLTRQTSANKWHIHLIKVRY